MNRSKFIPGKRDKRWLLYIIPFIVVVTAIIASLEHFMLGVAVGGSDVVILIVLSFIAGIAVFGFCYANFWIAAAASALGTLAGIIFMAYIFTQPVEWVGIVGLVSGAQLAFIFFLIGSSIQMLYCLAKKRGNTNGRKC